MPILAPSRVTFKYPFGAAVVGGFNPTQLPNLLVWLDPSNAASVTTGTGGIAQINDLGSAGNHFAQATTTQRPDYTGTIGGLSVMTYVSATTDFLACVNSITLGPSLTVASVHKATGAPVAQGVFGGDDVGGGHRIEQYRWESATAPTTIGFNGATAITVTGAGAPDVSAAAQMFVSVMDDTAHTITNYINGTANGTASGVAALNSGTFAPRIGQAAFTGGPWNGLVGEVVICNAALTTTQRQNLETYLRSKWGTP